MKDNLKIILEEFEKLKGQFVITKLNKVERLVAIGDDGEDWYYITFDGKNIHWSSCIGRIIPLKGYIEDDDYDYLVGIAKLNDWDQLNKEEFLIYFQKYVDSFDRDKFITVFWELN